ncbi:DUF5681 domain-containing protein [Minwuia thermotolerans]|uniref:DUF5681 domain-containing protein n=1 Tax=Minwuia thermotolerans TaxID=2056226 RepID=UPI000D6DC3F3|nr:DUF5681 domain-containing protein [Minwuia thermotolerans]
MSDGNGENEDKVGYGHPPAHTRFKPGRSGNPKGRPKGHRNFRTDLHEILNAVVRVKEKGEARTLTTQQAALYRLREKALNGDVRALDRLLALAAQHNGETLAHDSDEALPEEDRAILEQHLASGQAQAPGNAATEDDEGEPEKSGQEDENG